jgi:serine/threonine protein kinase
MSNFNDFTSQGYEVIKELGGNYSAGRIAYLARQLKPEKLVVIKQFQFTKSGSSWDGHKAIEREVEILQQLDHPNVPRYLSSFETDSGSCIVQEYIDGKPLSEIISSQQLYTPDQVKDIVLKLLEVLVYLQKEFTDPVIHRDIKPANILINSNGQPYLIDFGGAKVSEGEGGSTVAIGTLGFMPPEQRILKFNKTTDVYSLGLTIVCWLTRTEPGQMDNIIDLATNKVIKLRDQLSSYSLRFVDWVEKVVEPNPENRYPDAEAALNAFKPLYVRRVPEAIVSSSVLEFTAGKLGERLTQTLTVQNQVPETVLEGWWEVAPHPSDPPHTPDSHEWISFKPRKLSSNSNKCSIIVNTDKLMAAKTYNRQLLLHSNSSEETKEISLTLQTARIPIVKDKLPYIDLMYLLFVMAGTTSLLTIYLTAFIAIMTIIPGVIFCLSPIFSIVISLTLFSDDDNKSGCCAALTFSIVFISFPVLQRFIPGMFRFHILWTYGNAILPLITVVVLSTVVVLMILKIEREWRSEPGWALVLLSIIPGISIPLFFLMGSQNIWTSLALLSTSAPLVSVLLHPTLKQKKLVSKYRDSEKRLIKP